MRTIKFKAWEIAWDNKNLKQKQGRMLQWEDIKDDFSETLNRNTYFIVMQFTGLKDKEGVDIYEGDIYIWKQPLVKDGSQLYENHKCVVLFKIPELFYLKNRVENGRGVKVIGSVTDNPDLMKEDAK